MATWLLLKSGFPALPREIARVEAPDLDTAHARLGLLSGLGAANIARGAKDAMRSGVAHWAQSEASALVESATPREKPAAMRARRFSR